MPKNSILAKVIRTSTGRIFVYDGLTSRIISVKLIKGSDNISSDEDIISVLVLRGQLTEGKFANVDHTLDFAEYKKFLSYEIPALVLQTTRSCNLNCSYCIYSGNYAHMRPFSSEHMSLEVMFKSLDFYAAHSRKAVNADISFYGGEPFLFFDKIYKAVEYAKKTFCNKELEIAISSNGLLLNEQVSQWLSDNPNVKVFITLNGPFHDSFRKDFSGKGSLNTIMNNVQAVKEKFPDIFERQISFIANYFSFTEINEIRKFYNCYIEKPPELLNKIRLDMGNEIIQKFFPSDIKREDIARRNLQKEFMVNPNEPFLKLLYKARIELLDKRKIFAPEDGMKISCCLPFSVRIFIGADGKFNVCERTGDFFTLGDLKNGFNETVLLQAINDVMQFVNQNCKECWAQRICLICFQNLVNEQGKIRKKIPPHICNDIRRNLYELLQMYCEMYG